MTKPMTSKMDLLKKLKEHAEGCTGEERINAESILDRLMKKHGITDLDLESDEEKLWPFKVKNDVQKRLFGQISYMVTAQGNFYTDNKSKTTLYKKCTLSQKIEIETLCEFYFAAFEKEFERFTTAFVYKCHLFPKNHERDASELSEEQLAEFKKALLMQMGMDEHQFHKQIEQKK